MGEHNTDHPGKIPGKGILLHGLLLMVLAIGFVAIAFVANRWKSNLTIGQVQVKGNAIVSSKEILQRAAVPKGDKLFGLDLFAIQNRIIGNKFIRSVSVQRNVPDRVTIEVEERLPVAAILLDQLMYLDADGVVLPPAYSQGIFDLPVISGDFSREALEAGKQTPDVGLRTALRFLQLSKEIDDDLMKQISEVNIEDGNDIVFYTADGGVPVVMGHDDFGGKLVRFDAFWQQVVARHGAHELQYIDLRFDDEVVVRWNHTANGLQS